MGGNERVDRGGFPVILRGGPFGRNFEGGAAYSIVVGLVKDV